MLYIDSKYVGQISYKLRNFKKKNDYYWNFSCPICGDSKKNSLKARGFIFKHDNRLVYKCHNCGISTSIGNLIKQLDPLMYNEYVLERYKESTSNHTPHAQIKLETPKVEVELKDDVLDKLDPIEILPITHPAIQYLIKRKIPKDKWKLLYYTDTFKAYTNSVKFHFPNIKDDHPRIVIPYFNEHGKVFAFQARALGNEQPKYYSIKIDEKEEKIYALDRVDYSKRVYVTEGPIDSLFIPNCIAVSGASFDTPTIKSLASNATLIMDNEPRSKEICKFINKLIEAGYAVCLWPETTLEKDINEMVMAGKSIESIMDTINTNTFQGMEAKLKFIQWRKC
jgi:transcription elongation factor Elf1